MRKLGMIGGTGPESTIAYYRAITEGVRGVAGEEELPRLVIESLSVFEVMDMCPRGDLDALTDYLVDGVENLARAGAEIGTLTGLTPHLVFDRLQAASPIPLISAVDTSMQFIRRRGLSKLILLGTKFTMAEDFFTGPLRNADIDLIVPSSEEIDYIQSKIVGELEHSIINDDTRTELVKIVERLSDVHGAEHVILGCTELPLILDDRTSPVPTLNVADIHTEALIAAITGTTAT
ncbi:MAG: aspartate/glutamate racemase family protein [Leucobacter sp.]